MYSCHVAVMQLPPTSICVVATSELGAAGLGELGAAGLEQLQNEQQSSGAQFQGELREAQVVHSYATAVWLICVFTVCVSLSTVHCPCFTVCLCLSTVHCLC